MLCLDESGSMEGQPWQDVCNAFQQFLAKRVLNQATSDLVSVIQFDHTANIVMEGVPLQSNLGLLDYHGGGTHFIPPLITALEIHLRNQTAHTPVLIFMSDGEAADPHDEIIYVMRQLVQYCPSLDVHTVGFGHGASHSRLQVRNIFTWCQIVDHSTVVRKWQPRLGDSITRLSQESICQTSFRTFRIT